MVSRFDSPAWRVLGSAVSWAGFIFAFLGLYQAAGLVMGLGGYCASGGPYVIETECPDAVILFAPGGIFGMLIAAGIALFFARGFGVSLVAWAWPILFVGLGLQFLLAAGSGQGIVTNIICGVLFVGMGAVPVWFLVSSRALTPTILGSKNVAGQYFVSEGKARRYFGMQPKEEAEQVPATIGDWTLSVGLWLVSVALGAYLSYAAFTALTAGGAG